MAESVRMYLKRKNVVMFSIIFISAGIALFDLLRFTIWRNASWNYQYPDWAFVYDPLALSIFLLISLGVVFSVSKLLALSEQRFLVTLFGLTLIISVSAFFVTPIRSEIWALSPDQRGPIETFQYYPATIAAEEGITQFLSQFHSLSSLDGADRRQTAELLSSWLSSSSYIPGNQWLAAEADQIVTQRHGPIPALLIAPFLVIFGSSPEAAVAGSYIISAFIPIVGYTVFKQYFSARRSRILALLVLFSPIYIRLQRYGTISYDATTTLLVGISVIALIKAIEKNHYSSWFVAGIAFSLPALSKYTVLTYGISILLFIVITRDGILNSMVSTIAFGIGFLLIPLAFFAGGYNFLIQYLFSMARFLGGGGGGNSSFLFNLAISYYNVRWIGPAILILAISFAVYSIFNLKEVLKTKRYQITIIFILSTLPFALITGVTLSRHLFIHIYTIGLLAASGADLLFDEIGIRAVQMFLTTTLIVGLFAL